MEDLLKDRGIVDEISGIDIGCGASCVYCLLAVRMNPKWKMFALEIDDGNVKFAGGNIEQNRLDDRVDLVIQEHSKVIFTTLFKKFPSDKTFCICNPPFFKSHEEFVGENRSGKRKASKSAGSHCGSPIELITDGGELGFVTKILCESLELKEKVKIYSTMIGCKKNLIKFMHELRTRKVDNFVTTEFVQGKTMRWGIAWSFSVNLKDLKAESTVPNQSSSKIAGKVLSHQIVTEDFNQTFETVKTILSELGIQLKILDDKSDCIQCRLHVTKNTWSNQRTKRRAEAKNQAFVGSTTEVDGGNLEIGMEFRRIVEDSKAAELKMFFIDGNMNKDSVNQILQFIKNKVR